MQGITLSPTYRGQAERINGGRALTEKQAYWLAKYASLCDRVGEAKYATAAILVLLEMLEEPSPVLSPGHAEVKPILPPKKKQPPKNRGPIVGAPYVFDDPKSESMTLVVCIEERKRNGRVRVEFKDTGQKRYVVGKYLRKAPNDG